MSGSLLRWVGFGDTAKEVVRVSHNMWRKKTPSVGKSSHLWCSPQCFLFEMCGIVLIGQFFSTRFSARFTSCAAFPMTPTQWPRERIPLAPSDPRMAAHGSWSLEIQEIYGPNTQNVYDHLHGWLAFWLNIGVFPPSLWSFLIWNRRHNKSVGSQCEITPTDRSKHTVKSRRNTLILPSGKLFT